MPSVSPPRGIAHWHTHPCVLTHVHTHTRTCFHALCSSHRCAFSFSIDLRWPSTSRKAVSWTILEIEGVPFVVGFWAAVVLALSSRAWVEGFMLRTRRGECVMCARMGAIVQPLRFALDVCISSGNVSPLWVRDPGPRRACSLLLAPCCLLLAPVECVFALCRRRARRPMWEVMARGEEVLSRVSPLVFVAVVSVLFRGWVSTCVGGGGEACPCPCHVCVPPAALS